MLEVMSHKMDLPVDVFGPRILHRILGKFYSTLVIAMYGDGFCKGHTKSLRSHAASLVASARARYSASHVDMDTSDCNLLRQLVSELPILNAKAEVDRRSSRSP